MAKGIYLETTLLQSEAFTAIRSAKSVRILLEFYRRRVFHKRKGNTPLIMNNGQIELPFAYAKDRMGIPQTTYSRILDELVGLGFLDVAEMASGLHRQPTKWTLSDRWKLYGTTDFKSVKRKRIKPPHGVTGQKGQPFGASAKKIPVTMDGVKIA